jgi:outer membrane murein-binding lipoprotein Lpp
MKKIYTVIFLAFLSLSAKANTLADVAQCFGFIEQYEKSGKKVSSGTIKFINSNVQNYNKSIVPLSQKVNNCRGTNLAADRHKACAESTLTATELPIYRALTRGANMYVGMARDNNQDAMNKMLSICSDN